MAKPHLVFSILQNVNSDILLLFFILFYFIFCVNLSLSFESDTVYFQYKSNDHKHVSSEFLCVSFDWYSIASY